MTLAHEFIQSKKKKDYYDLQSHRYGFIPMPLFCLLLRIFSQSIKFTNEMAYVNIAIGFVW